ncbi:cytochrome c oxidase subunit II [Aquibacillus koreensis]|uniref:Cytochrome aa3 subunit 2 n=1 Tax=Aquibacillus koreensis TaxID=279446 RepID=A0A9X3WFB6_9BACI|nr:cytochrome c oxidase subunit II [Aquibacillus koreensis]MCT2537336.1 cytochrome c oxidase subunit II [Aquibacillus koreensis]MDC3418782.1 cytochrome c oxidase subunit II [Aquibacillus koreensis]
MHLHKYEKIWLIFGIGSLILFLVVLGVGAFYKGTHPPSHLATIDPQNVQAHESFMDENLGLRQVGEDQYLVSVIASAFNYNLGTDEDGKAIRTVRIPVDSTVVFQVTTTDVIHGFQLAGTNVNMMVEPGYISSLETTFKKPGTYTLLCNEYCGTGHHIMAATVEVYQP